jgi:hypothetical protein
MKFPDFNNKEELINFAIDNSNKDISLDDLIAKIENIYEEINKEKQPKLDIEILESGDKILFESGIRAVVIKNSRAEYIMYDGSTAADKTIKPYGYDMLDSLFWQERNLRIYSPKRASGFSTVKLGDIHTSMQLVFSNY